jgi:hypothetical protein
MISTDMANLRKMSRCFSRTTTRTTTVRLAQMYGKLKGVRVLLEWRNWQTHGTQNPAAFTGHESSTLSSSTIL